MQLETTSPESKFPNEYSFVIFIQIDRRLKKLLQKYKGVPILRNTVYNNARHGWVSTVILRCESLSVRYTELGWQRTEWVGGEWAWPRTKGRCSWGAPDLRFHRQRALPHEYTAGGGCQYSQPGRRGLPSQPQSMWLVPIFTRNNNNLRLLTVHKISGRQLVTWSAAPTLLGSASAGTVLDLHTAIAWKPVADQGGRRSNAEGTESWDVGRGPFLPTRSGRRLCLFPEICFDFWVENGAFWGIL